MNYPSSSIPNTNNSVPPQWVDDADDIHKSLSETTRLMNVQSSLHASCLGSVFGNDLEQMEGKIESLMRDVTDETDYEWILYFIHVMVCIIYVLMNII